MNNKQEIILLKGLPASGKSTWAKDFVKHHPEYVRVNKDDIRELYGNPKFSKSTERIVLDTEKFLGRNALDLGKSLIVDDTNFNPKHSQFWKLVALTRDIEYSEINFDTPLEECIKRDSERQKSVGKHVIMQMYKNYIENDKIENNK